MSGAALILPYSVVKISGPDASKFLQGQISCDVETLGVGQITFGTANTPKGRIYALFAITKLADDCFYLRIHESCTEGFLATLGKYAVFFKCEIETLSDTKVYGYFEPQTDHSSQPVIGDDSGLHIQLPWDKSRYEYWGILSSENTNSPDHSKDASLWFVHDVQSGIPEIYNSSVDTFILQQLNLQQLGAVSFTKGCYTGQEIIARMKYLGKNKKAMFKFETPDLVESQPGDKLRNADGKTVAELVRVHRENDKTLGLAVMNQEDAESQTVFEDENRSYSVSVKAISYEDTVS